jgi:hypothetical protein
MQQLFKIQNPFQVKAGQDIKGYVDCKPQSYNIRALEIEIGFTEPETVKTRKETFLIN